MAPRPPKTPNAEELLAALRQAANMHRDSELRGRELPLLKLSWVQRREHRAAPLMLALLGIFAASQFVVIWAIRPLMLRNAWYACVLVLWPFISAGLVFGWAWSKVYRWFSLVCPYCGATLSVRTATMSRKLPVDVERIRRCGSCRAVAIDPEA